MNNAVATLVLSKRFVFRYMEMTEELRMTVEAHVGRNAMAVLERYVRGEFK